MPIDAQKKDLSLADPGLFICNKVKVIQVSE